MAGVLKKLTRKKTIHSLLSWSKVGLGPKFHEAMTVGD